MGDKMSDETWRAEFYPIPAWEVPKEQAAQHSLQKWLGLMPSAMNRHGVTVCHAATSASVAGVTINAESCALCHRYMLNQFDTCEECPLAIVRGGVPCDHERQDEKVSPWFKWYSTGDPRAMIAWLEQAVAYVERNNDSAT